MASHDDNARRCGEIARRYFTWLAAFEKVEKHRGPRVEGVAWSYKKCRVCTPDVPCPQAPPMPPDPYYGDLK